MNEDQADPNASGESEISLQNLLARNRIDELAPPAKSEFTLPFDKLSPPMFERLVAETMWQVDGLSTIRVYGRSGQDQGGLDLVGSKGADLHVYQVRRVRTLTPAALRKAVTDFTGPNSAELDEGTIEDRKRPRRFDATRFVLVTACTIDDTHVEDELHKLKREYHGDIEIDLYDGQELQRKLITRGALVYSIFGPEWARVVCGHEAPQTPETPDGRMLVHDPVAMLGLGALRAEAVELESTDPGKAAVLFGQLNKALCDKRFAHYGQLWKSRQREALRAAGDSAGAFTVAMEVLVDLYEAGEQFHNEVQVIATLAGSLGGPAPHAAEIAAALYSWPEQGYDLEPVSAALRHLVEAKYDFAGKLLLLIAEQIVTDDDPRDDFVLLLHMASAMVGQLIEVADRTRLQCCIADLRVYAGTDPTEAFTELTRLAQGGELPPPLEALVLRRAARALAFAGKAEDAAAAYRRAVIQAANADHGGDARDALRSLSHIADKFEIHNDPFRSSRAIETRVRLLPGSDDAALNTMDAIIDGELADAHRWAHHWVRHERTSGSMYDEAAARRRYGDVFARAGMPDRAVHQYVLAGARKNAVAAARNATEPLDLSRYLAPRFPAFVHASAAAACAAQADLIPDDRVEATAQALSAVINSSVPHSIFSPSPTKYALGALAALERRLPVETAEHLLPEMLARIQREPGRHTLIDGEMLSFFSACVQLAHDEVATAAAKALLRCARLGVHDARRHLLMMPTRREVVLDEIAGLARSGDELAILTLAAWDYATNEVVAAAREASTSLLAREVGQPRTSWELGTDLGELIILLHGALAPTQDSGGSELVGLRDRVVLHLLALTEDHHDIAPNRSAALRALRGLKDRVPTSECQEVFTRLIALNDDPNLNEQDLQHQQSLHPFSRGRVNFRSELLAGEALLTASIYANEPGQAQAIYERLQRPLHSSLPDEVDAINRADTLLQVDRLVPVVPDPLVTHPAAHIRQAAAVCWARHDDRSPDLAHIFATDANRGVRRNLAHHLAHSAESSQDQYTAVLTDLKNDPSALVRSIARTHGS